MITDLWVQSFGVRSEKGYEKSYILVWNRVRILRTVWHTPTQNFGFGTNVLLASTDLFPSFSLSTSSGAHTYQRLETILINPLTIEIRISQMFPHPEVQRDYSEGEKDILFVCVTPLVLNILRWLPWSARVEVRLIHFKTRDCGRDVFPMVFVQALRNLTHLPQSSTGVYTRKVMTSSKES